MAFTTLITADELAEHLEDPSWTIFDCRFSLQDTNAGERSYADAHIPGAHYAHLDRDLAALKTPDTGRHPLPDPEEFAEWLGKRGVSGNSQVIVYDDSGGAIAARLWWMLRWLGHSSRAVLDGGWQAWIEGGFPTTSDIPELVDGDFSASPRGNLWLTTDQMVTALHGGRDLIIDARTPERYSGELEPLDPVAGHIPGAVNVPFAGNLDDSGRFLSAKELEKRFRDVLTGISPESVVHMCGSGVTACHNLLAMEIAGLSGSHLYVGSWSEWVTDPSRPIASQKQSPAAPPEIEDNR